jgi:hypothetical protein
VEGAHLPGRLEGTVSTWVVTGCSSLDNSCCPRGRHGSCLTDSRSLMRAYISSIGEMFTHATSSFVSVMRTSAERKPCSCERLCNDLLLEPRRRELPFDQLPHMPELFRGRDGDVWVSQPSRRDLSFETFVSRRRPWIYPLLILYRSN